MTKQLALRHAFRQRGAVEIDQRIDRSGGALVNSFRHQLFTGPRFTADQHVKIGARHNLDLFFQLRHRRRQADHVRLFYRFEHA